MSQQIAQQPQDFAQSALVAARTLLKAGAVLFVHLPEDRIYRYLVAGQALLQLATMLTIVLVLARPRRSARDPRAATSGFVKRAAAVAAAGDRSASAPDPAQPKCCSIASMGCFIGTVSLWAGRTEWEGVEC